MKAPFFIETLLSFDTWYPIPWSKKDDSEACRKPININIKKYLVAHFTTDSNLKIQMGFWGILFRIFPFNINRSKQNNSTRTNNGVDSGGEKLKLCIIIILSNRTMKTLKLLLYFLALYRRITVKYTKSVYPKKNQFNWRFSLLLA